MVWTTINTYFPDILSLLPSISSTCLFCGFFVRKTKKLLVFENKFHHALLYKNCTGCAIRESHLAVLVAICKSQLAMHKKDLKKLRIIMLMKLTPGANRGVWTQTPDLGMLWQVFNHRATSNDQHKIAWFRTKFGVNIKPSCCTSGSTSGRWAQYLPTRSTPRRRSLCRTCSTSPRGCWSWSSSSISWRQIKPGANVIKLFSP